MRNILLLAVVIFFPFLGNAQQQPTLQQKLQSDVDINTQFQLLLNQSRNQDAAFKIIRRTNVEIIQKNVADSLSSYRKKIAQLTSSSSASSGTIKALEENVSSLQAALSEEQLKTSTIVFFGIHFKKGTYHAIVWTIILTLVLALLVSLFSLRKATVDVVEHKKTSEDAQQELQAFKKKAMEKEQQLKRQLLDEQLKRNA